MSALATLTSRLTLPYRRGAEFLPIPLGADFAGATAFLSYDFAEYRARWGQDPAGPAYVIAPRQDISLDDLTLTFTYDWNGAKTTTLTVPHGTRAGTGFAIPLAPGADATLRFTSLKVVPLLDGSGKDAWDVVALLGTITKLVWLLGEEKETIARVRDDVRNMRFVESAFGSGLDALGKDMRVERFPPRPYSIDDATIALWHLDELPNGGPVTTVVDQTTRLGVSGHAGTVVGAVAGVPGKFGTGFAFLPNPASAISAVSSTDFDIAADATIEAFFSTDIPTDPTPRAIVIRRATETVAGSNSPGWSLCVVNARGFDANILFALCDGVHEIRIFADVGTADNRFHHVAAIVDRTRKRARLFVDGVQRSTAPIDAFGAVAPPIEVRLGSSGSGNALSGTIDEVRISRVARTTFHPALGEDDEAYRARLRIFRHWVLPTPAKLTELINEAAPLGNELAPYFLVEANQPIQVAECPVRIVPASLAAGTAIAVDGSAAQDETVAGTPDDDAGFDPSLDLIDYANPGVDATTDPGGAQMQAGAGKALDALVARLVGAATPGMLILERSYDPSGPTPLHSVGRALRLHHQTLTVGPLAALAHRAGFTYVCNLGPNVAVAVPAGERLAIRSAPAVTQRVDVGSAFDLTIEPALPPAGTFSWTIATPGPARARFVGHSADLFSLTTNGATPAANATLHFAAVPGTVLPGMVIVDLTAAAVIPNGATVVSKTATTVVMSQNATGAGVGNGDVIQFLNRAPIASRPRVRLVTDSAGDLVVRCEYGLGGRTRSGSLSLRVDPTTLSDGHALDTIGRADPDFAAIVGTPDSGFDPSYLVTHAPSPGIKFGVDPNSSKMQVVSRDALDALVALLALRATPGSLMVTQAFVPGGPGVENVGRRIVLGHETLDPGVLGALASRFFDYVRRTGSSVSAFMRPDIWIEIGDAVTTAPVPAEIVLGTPIKLTVAPGTLLPGTYNWSTRAIGAGAGVFDTLLRPTVLFTPSKIGLVVLALTYVARDPSHPGPYAFEIRLKPALDVPATIIPKVQYDLIMNVLDSLHPVGVEVRTDRLRQHVPEIEHDQTKAFPAYSFPNFRI
jgi:hypothetical protein